MLVPHLLVAQVAEEGSLGSLEQQTCSYFENYLKDHLRQYL